MKPKKNNKDINGFYGNDYTSQMHQHYMCLALVRSYYPIQSKINTSFHHPIFERMRQHRQPMSAETAMIVRFPC